MLKAPSVQALVAAVNASNSKAGQLPIKHWKRKSGRSFYTSLGAAGLRGSRRSEPLRSRPRVLQAKQGCSKGHVSLLIRSVSKIRTQRETLDSLTAWREPWLPDSLFLYFLSCAHISSYSFPQKAEGQPFHFFNLCQLPNPLPSPQ